jgi:hypothetical protein
VWLVENKPHAKPSMTLDLVAKDFGILDDEPEQSAPNSLDLIVGLYRDQPI